MQAIGVPYFQLIVIAIKNEGGIFHGVRSVKKIDNIFAAVCSIWVEQIGRSRLGRY